ncbi:hypothetical protein [Actibacterium sp. MT2.3-13A]|nr:hypothetical protein [Actibacterium sp. MT2.3-13A]
MSDKVALFLALVIVAALGADYVFADLSNSLFLARKLSDLRVYIAFWR